MKAVYASARDQGLTDEMIAALPHYRESDLFTPREKAALRLADTMARDHRRVSDDLFEELREHFSESEIMAVGWRAGIFIGYGRLVYAVGLESVGDLCPLSFTHEDAEAGAHT
jgi:alkylhydroperoxidase family enzyme